MSEEKKKEILVDAFFKGGQCPYCNVPLVEINEFVQRCSKCNYSYFSDIEEYNEIMNERIKEGKVEVSFWVKGCTEYINRFLHKANFLPFGFNSENSLKRIEIILYFLIKESKRKYKKLESKMVKKFEEIKEFLPDEIKDKIDFDDIKKGRITL